MSDFSSSSIECSFVPFIAGSSKENSFFSSSASADAAMSPCLYIIGVGTSLWKLTVSVQFYLFDTVECCLIHGWVLLPLSWLL